MTRQEEIQGFMRGWLKYAQGTSDDGGIDYALKQMTSGLDSQGVVIKKHYAGMTHRNTWQAMFIVEPLVEE